jgi:epoxyqueuosine reductase
MLELTPKALGRLADEIKTIGTELGFAKLGITDTELDADEAHLERWLADGRCGDMHYMRKHGTKRARPAELVPGTVRVICARMDYWPPGGADAQAVLADPGRGYIARYALGRDYHRVLRPRLKRLASAVERRIGRFGYRVFVDSGPVLEKALARNAGLGWIGKHTNLLDRDAGSWFLLGEIFTDLPLPVDRAASAHCGSCRACLDVCPTRAIVAPYELDARRCISYLTIEQRGPIPPALRAAIGNRIFGCDDCQLVCPWNKFARSATCEDFVPRHGLESRSLLELFAWTEDEWQTRTEGSAVRRAGYPGWLRNVAVALGNAPRSDAVIAALNARSNHPSALVREHVTWALARQGERASAEAARTIADDQPAEIR